MTEKLLVKQLEVGKLAVFCYIVADRKSREGLIIDPGGSPNEIVEGFKEEGIRIHFVVNTHSHSDHTCGNEKIIRATGAKLIIHSMEEKSVVRFHKGIFNRLLGGSPSPKPDILIQNGDSICIGDSRLKVIHTPGHTKGGICLYGDSNLFTGDTLFVGGIGRTDLPGGSKKAILNSIKNGICTLPNDTKVWPGHNYGVSPSSTVLYEKLHNPFLSVLSREVKGL